MRGATRDECESVFLLWISTHAPRAGSDERADVQAGQDQYFNPRSPCGERRWLKSSIPSRPNFNPRSPCGERREPGVSDIQQSQFQPTLPVRGATSTRMDAHRWKTISTHAPRAGSDPSPARRCRSSAAFQPTLPVRGATGMPRSSYLGFGISTHAPRAGSDGRFCVL